MNYQEAIDYIESLSPTQVKPGLERFHLFAEECGKPQDQIASLHVAGTNGKGSVACMLAETLTQAGLQTGRYTGPHLLSFNERFEISGSAIADDEFAVIMTELKRLSEDFASRHPEHGQLSWFEIITAVAIFEFAKKRLDAAVYEVGLGGQFDATNILTSPVVTGIVTVSLDHMHLLGSSEKEIAREKAGIIKKAVPIVTACTGDALAQIKQIAIEKSAPLICVSQDTKLKSGSESQPEKELIDAIEKRFKSLSPTIAASISKQSGYQRINASVAATMLGVWEIEKNKNCLDKFENALSNYFWPGRLQYFEKNQLILDGAHNEAGAKALKESLDELFPNKARCFVLSFYQSKRFREALKQLLQPGDLVFASQAVGRRPVVPVEQIVMTARELGAQAESFQSLEEALKALLELDKGDRLRIATGSFATVSAALKFMGYKCAEASRMDSRTLLQPAGA